MTVSYLDASAAMKLVVEESETSALIDELAAEPDRRLVASWLLHTELHCAAGRHPDAVSPDAIGALLETVTLFDLTRGDMIAAGGYQPLRSNDALHLAVAVRLGVDELVTYDTELADAALALGIRVSSPR